MPKQDVEVMKTIKQQPHWWQHVCERWMNTEAQSRWIKMIIASGTFYIINSFSKENTFSTQLRFLRNYNMADKFSRQNAACCCCIRWKKMIPAMFVSQCCLMFTVCVNHMIRQWYCPKVGGVTVTTLKWAESSAKGHFLESRCWMSFFILLLNQTFFSCERPVDVPWMIEQFSQ